jgi:uncharacterized protein YhbP (UPF0306 family)
MTELRSRLLDFLRRHDTMTLATTGPGGEPQAAAVFYAADEQLNLYFLSDPSSRHGRNLKRSSRVAATVQADGQAWREIRGLQIEGTARETAGSRETARAAGVYVLRFEFMRDIFDNRGAISEAVSSTALRDALAGTRLHILQPSWIRLIDNTAGFGHKEELTLRSSGPESGNGEAPL